MRNIDYIYNTVDKTITGKVISKGQEFTAEAKLYPGDNYSQEIGELIVRYRLEIQQRRRDLQNTNDVIEKLRAIYNDEHAKKEQCRISKHWMRFIQEANEERKSQLENIAFAKAMVDILTNSDGCYEKMIRKIVSKHYKDDRASNLLITLFNISQTKQCTEEYEPQKDTHVWTNAVV